MRGRKAVRSIFYEISVAVEEGLVESLHATSTWQKGMGEWEVFPSTFHVHVKLRIVPELDEDKHFDVPLC